MWGAIKQSIGKSYFLITILLVAMLPLIIVTYLSYTISRDSLKKEVKSYLTTLAEERASATNKYMLKKEQNVTVLAHSPSIITAAKKMISLEGREEQKESIINESFLSYLKYFMSQYGYNGFYLVTDLDKPILSLKHSSKQVIDGSKEVLGNTALLEVIAQSRILLQSKISKFVYKENEILPNFYIASPIFDKGALLGVIVLELNNDELFKVLTSTAGLPPSGEVILASKIDGKILVVNQLLFAKDKNSQDKMMQNDFTKHLEKAVLGEKGFGLFKDYRNAEVIAVWQYIPSLEWGMVIKEDTAEAFLPIIRLRQSILILGSITLLLLMLIASFVSKKLQEAEDFLTNVINSMPSTLVIVDNAQKIIKWNQQAETSTHRSLERAKGKSIVDLFPYLASHVPMITKAIVENQPQKINKILYSHPPDSPDYFEVVIYPLKGKHTEKTVIRIDNINSRIKLEDTIQQNDKLASIGVLTAGIAHEINNPINFVSASIPPIKNNLADITDVLDKYSITAENQVKNPVQTVFVEKIQEIDKLKQDIDLAFSIEETRKLLDGIQDGAQRTAEIVKDLRTFSRLDEMAMKKVDLQECLDSTLRVLNQKLGDRIKIVKKYGTIPEVECYPGKLNQAFMNVIMNAIQAISGEGVITVETSQAGENVHILILDTGEGIPPENLPKIFEPFFTTRPVGSGRGLGLSISYGIILELHGNITVRSEYGKGTAVTITIPIVQKSV